MTSPIFLNTNCDYPLAARAGLHDLMQKWSCPTGTAGFESRRIELPLRMSAGKINLLRKFISNCHFFLPLAEWGCHSVDVNGSLLSHQHPANSMARKINFLLKY